MAKQAIDNFQDNIGEIAMNMLRVALVAAALSAVVTTSPLAQPGPTVEHQGSSPTQPSSPNAAPVSQPNPPAPGQAFPSNITVELKGASASSSPSSGWIVAIISGICVVAGAIVAAGGTYLVASFNSEKTRILEQLKISANREIREADRTSEDTQHEDRITLQAAISAADRTSEDTRHKDRITLQMEELQQKASMSAKEAYMAAVRLTHERDLAQANLVHTFFEKLLSKIQSERDLALLAISAFIDPQRITQLAAGGEDVVSRESLSRLAARGEEDVATVAQGILNLSAVAVKSKLVRVYKKGDATIAANGFISDQDLIITYPVVQQGEALEIELGPRLSRQFRDGSVSFEPHGARIEADCLAVDDKHSLAVVKSRENLNETPLLLREKPIESSGTKIRVAQWSGNRFIVRAGEVVAVDMRRENRFSATTEKTAFLLPSTSEVVDALRLRVLTEPGNAGAPVLDEEGRVAGVILAGDLGDESSLAAPASAIRALLSSVRNAAREG